MIDSLEEVVQTRVAELVEFHGAPYGVPENLDLFIAERLQVAGEAGYALGVAGLAASAAIEEDA